MEGRSQGISHFALSGAMSLAATTSSARQWPAQWFQILLGSLLWGLNLCRATLVSGIQ